MVNCVTVVTPAKLWICLFAIIQFSL